MFIIIMSLVIKNNTRRFLTTYRLASVNNVSLLNYMVFLVFFFRLYNYMRCSNTKLIFLYSFLFYRIFNIKKLITQVESNQTTKALPFFFTKKSAPLYNLYNIIYSLLPIQNVTDYSIYTNKDQQNTFNLKQQNNSNLFSFESSQLAYNNFELSQFEVFFLRKNRVFNKGRYSRNRQNYRTGVYICFYLSIASIFGLYYTFYRFSFNLSYLWFGFIFFVGSFFFSKFLRYNLWSIFSIKNSFKKLLNWLSLLRL